MELEKRSITLNKSTIIKIIVAQLVLFILCIVLVWFFGWSIHNIGIAIRQCAVQKT